MLDLYPCLRPLLFVLPPEAAHAVALAGLSRAYQLGLLPKRSFTSVPVSLMGLRFPNRLGLAAGLDKNASYVDALGALGVGFIEVGTVTPQPQSGNDRPRLFRLVRDRALINRMGFPNDGVNVIRLRLSKRHYGGICGVNIGKNAATPLQHADADYIACLKAVYAFADYIAINISSPNTADLRLLQQGELLRSLLSVLLEARHVLTREWGRKVPVLIKLAADLPARELSDAARLSVRCGIDGIIATNTTVRRDALLYSGMEEGGLSGAPLLRHALNAVQCIRAEVGSSFSIIGVGGIQSADDAVAMRAAGADLVQIYTGLIYRGPKLIRNILAHGLAL